MIECGLMFYKHIPDEILFALNGQIYDNNFDIVKAWLPESFLQRRIVCTNYKTLRHIYQQRKDHKLSEWREFCECLLRELVKPEYLT